jgi:hypothetical protein
MEATCSSETSVYNKPTRRHMPEDGILHGTNSSEGFLDQLRGAKLILESVFIPPGQVDVLTDDVAATSRPIPEPSPATCEWVTGNK